MVDTTDSKSVAHCVRGGSSPPAGTNHNTKETLIVIFVSRYVFCELYLMNFV